MIRIISVIVFAGLAAALLLVPGVSREELAVQQIAGLVTEKINAVGPDGKAVMDAEGKAVTRPFWQFVLDEGAVELPESERSDGPKEATHKFIPGGVRFDAIEAAFPRRDGVEYDPRVVAEWVAGANQWHLQAGKNIVRELRSVVAQEDLRIAVKRYKKPDPEGINLDGKLTESTITLTASKGGETVAVAEKEWRPVTQLSLFPPLLVVFLAIVFRRPVLALLAAVWAGAFLVKHSADGPSVWNNIGASLGAVAQDYFWPQFIDSERREIALFVVAMLAMVGIITRAGGIQGMMNRISSLAKDARRTQIATWLMGLSIFFDDYANTILVGSTMRPLADKFKVAREKLAYVVDSTAAPVAGVSLLSTWIAFEVSTFSAQLPDAGLAPSEGYSVFIQTLPYRFYCWSSSQTTHNRDGSTTETVTVTCTKKVKRDKEKNY